MTILHINASARNEGSTSRMMSQAIVNQLDDDNIIHRDVATGLPFVTADWVTANFTDPEQRDDAQNAVLAISDELIAELESADTIVIGTPVYNFGIPASLKAWIDLIARARKTFQYTASGPEGLLTGKKAYIAIASGGTEIGSEIDFASTYLRHVLGFVGISDITLFSADRQMINGQKAVDAALDAIAQL